MLTRRDFLAPSLALGAYPLVGRTQNASSNAVFRHGVASGDPLTDRVILWTRVTPGTGKPDRLRSSGPLRVTRTCSACRRTRLDTHVRRARLHGQN